MPQRLYGYGVDRSVDWQTRGATILRKGLVGPVAFAAPGPDVLYRERWHGIELRRRAHVVLQVVGCAVRTTARVPSCPIPAPFS